MYGDFSYMHHSLVGNWNKLPSCECELFVSCGDDEHQTSLEWNRSSNPVAPPSRVSHTFSLKYEDVTQNKLLHIRIFFWKCKCEGRTLKANYLF
jgi:hypothetical protein